MAEREKGNLLTARTEICIVTDAQSIGLLLHRSNNGAFDLAFAARLDNDHLQPQALHRGVREPDVILHEAGIVWIHKEGNPTGAGKDLMQQLHPLSDKLDS